MKTISIYLCVFIVLFSPLNSWGTVHDDLKNDGFNPILSNANLSNIYISPVSNPDKFVGIHSKTLEDQLSITTKSFRLSQRWTLEYRETDNIGPVFSLKNSFVPHYAGLSPTNVQIEGGHITQRFLHYLGSPHLGIPAEPTAHQKWYVYKNTTTNQYVFVNKSSNKVLEVALSDILQWSYIKTNEQKFTIETYNGPTTVGTSGLYRINKIGNNKTKFLDLNGGTQSNNGKVQQYDKYTNFNQVWAFKEYPSGSGYYTIQNFASKTFLDLKNTTLSNGEDVTGKYWNAPVNDGQLWYFRIINGQRFIINLYSDKVLEIAGTNNATNGAVAQVSTYTGADNQQWQITKAYDIAQLDYHNNNYRIKSGSTNHLYIGRDPNGSGNVATFTNCNGCNNQKWTISGITNNFPNSWVGMKIQNESSSFNMQLPSIYDLNNGANAIEASGGIPDGISWVIIKDLSVTDGYPYIIVKEYSRKVLDIGATTVQWTYHGAPHQRFLLEKVTSSKSQNLPTTKVPEEEKQNYLIYPNPVHSNFTFQINTQTNTLVRFKIINSQGQEIKNIETRLAKGRNQFQVDVSELIPGYYTIQGTVNNKNIIKRFVKT